jgi:hypothetical protein
MKPSWNESPSLFSGEETGGEFVSAEGNQFILIITKKGERKGY